MLQYWIWLASFPGLHTRKKQQLLETFGTPELVFYAQRSDLTALDILNTEQIDRILDRDLCLANRILEECAQKGIGILTCYDTIYSQKLRSIEDAPIALYYKGTMPPVDARPSIAVVGTRAATDYGLLHAKRFGYHLGKGGAVVISGCALGIDTLAMKGALTAGGSVIGVLGCGVDWVYPRQNAELFEDICHYGCLLSPYPPGTPPKKENFPRRNRLMSGLSDGVVVIEAPINSGAMITANYAAIQGRDLFALPGSVDAAGSAGPHRLIQQGAFLVENGAQVLETYLQQYQLASVQYGQSQMNLHPDERALPKQEKKRKERRQENDKNNVDKEVKKAYIDDTILNQLDAGQQKIVLALQDGPKMAELLAQELELPAPELLAALTLLQVSGFVVRAPDGQYGLINQ